jgi:hypothetical protein
VDNSPTITAVTMFTRIMCLGTALTLSVATTAGSQSPMTLAEAVRQFQIGTVPERVHAFYALDRVPGSWTQPGASRALLAVVEREGKEHDSIIRASGSRSGSEDTFGEDYAEYDGQLVDRCLESVLSFAAVSPRPPIAHDFTRL